MIIRAALKQAAGRLGSGRQQPLEPLEQSLRAWPWICDPNRHVNNVQYLKLSQDARTRWLVTNGLLVPAIRGNFRMVVTGSTVLYRRPIPLLAGFRLVSQLCAAEERFLAFAHTFYLRGESQLPAARVLARLQMSQNGHAVDPAAALANFGLDRNPNVPADYETFIGSQGAALSFLNGSTGE